MVPKTQKPARPPAMTDVAALAGVSHQTVSRVLNDADLVKAETRERVLAAIAELGYRRNEYARSLVTHTSRSIGVVSASFVDFGPASTTQALQKSARAKGYFSSIVTMDEVNADTLRDSVDFLLDQGIAALVIVAATEEISDALDEYSIPVPIVAIASGWTERGSSVGHVGVDQTLGAMQAVEHLIERGAKRIDHVCGPDKWYDATKRITGWRLALSSKRLAQGRILGGDWSSRTGYQAAQFMIREGLPDAVFCANDALALGLLRAFAERDIRVPNEVRVVGFDNESGSGYFYPSLTTVAQDFDSLGTAAIEMVGKMLRGEKTRDLLTAPKLIIRDSS